MCSKWWSIGTPDICWIQDLVFSLLSGVQNCIKGATREPNFLLLTISWFGRDWRDPAWTKIPLLKAGLTTETRSQRQTLFGRNVVDVEAKSTFALLVEEVGYCPKTSVAMPTYPRFCRFCIHSIYFRLRALSSGLSTITTITRSALL